MHRWFRTVLCGAALAFAPSLATAQSSRSFDVCGGSYQGISSLGFCAAVDVAVDMVNNLPTVTMKVWNLSGSTAIWDPSYAWSTLVGIGLTNVIPSSANVVNGSLKVVGPCAANPNGCDYSQYWAVGNNFWLGGLIIDMLAIDVHGGGIVSSCDPNNPLITRNPYLYTSCNRNAPGYATLTFNMTEMFDLADGGDLFLKGQAPSGSMTYCMTGPNLPECTGITAAPEPGTLLLLGSGLASFGGMGFFRRRRKTEETVA
jgi:hypothetical protein